MLEVVVVVALILSIACAAYGFFAFFRETKAEKDVKAAAKDVNEAAKAVAKATTTGATLAGGITPQAAFSGPTEYLKALAAFSDSLAKLKRDVAAFVLSLAFLLVAVAGASVEDKVKDQPTATTASPAATSP
ncbi:MAG: hypothetical protein H0U51_00495 [Propionibacteriales bacterium]|nr:hypothetical protein [Propionibacteriales bacterium]